MDRKTFVPELIKRLKIEYEKKDRSGIYALTQRLMAYNSNKIEGSALTEDQTASLFDTGTIKADGDIIRAKDIEEMSGHFAMFNRMLETYEMYLCHELIHNYHYLLKVGVFEDFANGYPIGRYKTRKNIVGTMETTEPNKVFSQMEDLINKYNLKEEYKLEDLAQFHSDYEKIHPFQDGNGRTGRIILFKECLRLNIVPFVIPDSKKLEYYDALKWAQVGINIEPLTRLFEACQEDYIKAAEGFL